jgi:hypothetical protein
MTEDAVWNDRVALYCLSLLLGRGDASIPDTRVPGYLRFQCTAARIAGRDEVADALDEAADTYAQGAHGLAYAILLKAMAPPETPET